MRCYSVINGGQVFAGCQDELAIASAVASLRCKLLGESLGDVSNWERYVRTWKPHQQGKRHILQSNITVFYRLRQGLLTVGLAVLNSRGLELRTVLCLEAMLHELGPAPLISSAINHGFNATDTGVLLARPRVAVREEGERHEWMQPTHCF